MNKTHPPLIVVTNDDGIGSPGLWAAVEGAQPLGEILVVAPDRQWSGAGRSMPLGPQGRISRRPQQAGKQEVSAYQVDASPALAVIHALKELAPRPPDLLISGVNYGENLGSDVTISGTVGAALQGAICGVPSLALSLQTPRETHANLSDTVDFSVTVHFTRLFARHLLMATMPFDADVLKVDIPSSATPDTPWRLTRLSRHAYFVSIPPDRQDLAQPGALDYRPLPQPERTEPDSDIYALAVDRVISVAPVSIDLTARVDLAEVDALLRGQPTR
jgi:5'-nucleotidase